MPLAHTVSEANFSHADLVDRDVVPVLSRGALAALPMPVDKSQTGPDAFYQTAGTALGASTSTGPDSAAFSTGRQSDDSSCDGRTDQSSAATSTSTAASTAPDMGKAQAVVKTFVRTYVKGQKISVLTVSGDTTECIATLDRRLTTLSLQRSAKKDAKKRGILLAEINQVCMGQEAGDEIDLPLDENCVTLLLEDGNAVGFRFEDVEERDTFALCLSMFVDGRRTELERKGKENVAIKGKAMKA